MAKNEKTFNEQNMRKIIRILSGLSASQQQLAEQCVNEYQADKTYSKDNICFYNGTLYRAKTVTLGNTPSPESAYFEMLDGVEEEIDAQYIETLMSTVSAETFDYMKNFINDDIISGTHGYSSSKIYTEIQNAIQTAKDYTLTQVANSSTGSYVIVTGTDEIVDDKHLFLIANGSSYDIYALVNGAPTKIGDTSVSLNGLLTEATAETTYLKQVDATATYATITTTDGLRTDLDNHTNDTVAHLTQNERDNLVTTNVLGDYAKIVDLPTPRTDDEIKTLADGQISAKITTTISSSSTDDQIPSAKNVYANLNAKCGMQSPTVLANYTTVFDWAVNNMGQTVPYQGVNLEDCPLGNTYGTLVSIGGRLSTGVKVIAYSNYNGKIYTRTIKGNTVDVATWAENDWVQILTTFNTVNYDSNEVDLSLIPNMELMKNTFFGNRVSSNMNKTDDPDATSQAIIRTRHDNCPTNDMEYIVFTTVTDKKYGDDATFNDKAEKKQIAIIGGGNSTIYIRSKSYGATTWQPWKRLCTTKVADVPLTNITIPTNMFNSYNANSYIKYEVKNGIAYFYIGIRDAGFKSTGVSFNINVPKCSTKLEHIIISENRESNISVIIQDRDMQLWCLGNTNATNFLATFSYPVAES